MSSKMKKFRTFVALSWERGVTGWWLTGNSLRLRDIGGLLTHLKLTQVIHAANPRGVVA